MPTSFHSCTSHTLQNPLKASEGHVRCKGCQNPRSDHITPQRGIQGPPSRGFVCDRLSVGRFSQGCGPSWCPTLGQKSGKKQTKCSFFRRFPCFLPGQSIEITRWNGSLPGVSGDMGPADKFLAALPLRGVCAGRNWKANDGTHVRTSKGRNTRFPGSPGQGDRPTARDQPGLGGQICGQEDFSPAPTEPRARP